ncbi:MAG: DUF4249 domain-containing protein [Bacteroidales bacterium]
MIGFFNRFQGTRTLLVYFTIGVILVQLGSCREIYHPELDLSSDVLVVEALFTNEAREHSVVLTRSWQFTQDPAWKPEPHAIVWISDQLGDSIPLSEKQPGRYFTQPDVFAQFDRNYTLHIITAEGDYYRSLHQVLPDSVSLDTVYGRTEFLPILYDIGNGNQQLDLKVISLLADISSPFGERVRVRFENELMLMWQIRQGPMEDIQRFYHWLSRDITPYMRVRTGQQDINTSALIQQQFAFFPFSRLYLRIFGFPDELEFNSGRIIKTRLYALNADAAEFYELKEKQLQAEGQLFDPAYIELLGNIRHVDGTKRVLGFFEVSHATRFSFQVRIPSANHIDPYVKSIDDLSDIPSSGFYHNEVPPFWTF